MMKGQIVRIKKGFENAPAELLMKFVVVEAFENRSLIQPMECTLAFIPTEFVPNESIEKVEG